MQQGFDALLSKDLKRRRDTVILVFARVPVRGCTMEKEKVCKCVCAV